MTVLESGAYKVLYKCYYWQSWNVIGGGAVSSDSRLPSMREQEPFTSCNAYCSGGVTVLEVCLITGG
jgi:hypothetical protein